MGVSHSMNNSQVDSVLTQFEATVDAIKGIESKVQRTNHYLQLAQKQRVHFNQYAEKVTLTFNNLSGALGKHSDHALDFFTTTLDNLAGLCEGFELTVLDLGLQDLPGQIQREFGPLLMPAIVLVLIITVSNCVFGFFLAEDEELTEELHLEFLPEINIVRWFAIIHVIVICAAAVYLVSEGARSVNLRIRRAKAHAAREVRFVEDKPEPVSRRGCRPTCLPCRGGAPVPRLRDARGVSKGSSIPNAPSERSLAGRSGGVMSISVQNTHSQRQSADDQQAQPPPQRYSVNSQHSLMPVPSFEGEISSLSSQRGSSGQSWPAARRHRTSNSPAPVSSMLRRLQHASSGLAAQRDKGSHRWEENADGVHRESSGRSQVSQDAEKGATSSIHLDRNASLGSEAMSI